MPPKASGRGRGRPKTSAAPVVDVPKKRGRAAKEDVADTVAEPSKKRGRPAKTQAEEPPAPVAAAVPAKRGRRSLAAPAPVVEDAPKKRAGGQPRKAQPAEAEATVGPKRRGRPAKAAQAVNLNRVANVGSPRVAKRTSTRPQRTPVKAAPAVRLDPRMRSKLRTRQPAAEKVKKQEPVAQPAKRRGRPAKAAVAAPAPKKGPKKTTGPKPASAKPAPAKPTAPRKKRGYTSVEIPDKFVTQIEQYLQDLQEADTLPTPVEDDAEAEGENHIDENVEVGEEHIVITSAAPTDGQEEDLSVDGGNTEELGEIEEPSDVSEQGEQPAQLHANGDVVQQDEFEKEVEEFTEELMNEVTEEPTEEPTEMDVELSIQEEVHMDQDTGEEDAIVEEVSENIEIHEDDSLSFDDDDEDLTGAFVSEPEPSHSAGTIFG